MANLKDLLRPSNPMPSKGVVGQAVQAAMAAMQAERTRKAEEAVVAVVKTASEKLEESRAEFAELRKKKAEAARKLVALEKGFAYFMETGNPLPMLGNGFESREFCEQAGIDVPEENSEFWKIPSDWKSEQAVDPIKLD